ncbi:MAG TPA: AmmeMemoRadiSam system protein A [Candidatus Saccharimonadia bacterium]|jgi:AmmeMemoRadiSam system protein A|nr:AmmeMemoRadiSam system protein A [Candidatus Saccharimonadia bacterium]
MLVYGVVSPHPPIILPEVGGDELKRVRSTIRALEAADAKLAEAKPQELIIISPHEDHGFEVPEYYLSKHLPGSIHIQEILVTGESYRYYYNYGREVGQQLRYDMRRYAIVASGDLSHVLRPEGPYGFNPAGPQLDELIVEAMRTGDAEALLSINAEVLQEGAECGLRSVLFLLGAFAGMRAETKVESYEGPFGVGYMVATVAPHNAGKLTIAEVARDAVQYGLETGELLSLPGKLPPSWRERAGAFVSLHEPNGTLRGCIGTIAPTKETLAEEVVSNAVAAATQDPRFEPVTPGELDGLAVSVDVLSKPVLVRGKAKLDPKKYGVIVSTKDGREGVLLPDLPGVDTHAKQLEICREKAGIGLDERVQVRRFTVRRYQL